MLVFFVTAVMYPLASILSSIHYYLFLLYLIIWLVFRLPYQILVGAGILQFILVPVLITLKGDFSNQTALSNSHYLAAVYPFFSLIAGLICAFGEQVRKTRKPLFKLR
jgi:hypothetical protein